MRILVVDVAAEHGGAKTILEQFCKEFDMDNENEYIVALSVLRYQDTDNVRYLNYDWVKQSLLHRTFFDRLTMIKLIRKYNPDIVFSLQNNAVYAGEKPQYVYFQNALPLSEKRFRIHESRYLWFYQTFITKIIRLSLNKATRIYVQTAWMKNKIITKWNIDASKILVKGTTADQVQTDICERRDDPDKFTLFYPANYSLYKNHRNLINALIRIWKREGVDCGLSIILTGNKENLPQDLRQLIEDQKYPIEFVGRLNENEMRETYLKSTLIFPSYLETVGLPLVEAKQYKSWILCSDLEYAHESVGDYDKVVYFNPFSEESIVKCISDFQGKYY